MYHQQNIGSLSLILLGTSPTNQKVEALANSPGEFNIYRPCG